jgi:hypothetical protein
LIEGLTFVVHDHGGKSLALQTAIIEQGGLIVQSNPDILLIDHDGTPYYQNIIDQFKGATVILYPHGSDAFPAWDGVYEPHDRTAGLLHHAAGYKMAMKAYGYPKPVKVIGWYETPIKAFKPVQTQNPLVLFAPIHALGNGYMRTAHLTRNVMIYSWLLSLGGRLRVRHVGPLETNGLFPAYKVQFSPARFETMLTDIDEADVVIACGTFARLAIAKGKPTICFDGGLPYMDSDKVAEHWDEYAELVEYPQQLIKDDTLIGFEKLWLESDRTIKMWK